MERYHFGPIHATNTEKTCLCRHQCALPPGHTEVAASGSRDVYSISKSAYLMRDNFRLDYYWQVAA